MRMPIASPSESLCRVVIVNVVLLLSLLSPSLSSSSSLLSLSTSSWALAVAATIGSACSLELRQGNALCLSRRGRVDVTWLGTSSAE
ncbi:hypothetical protein EDB89DRAFT_1984391 [Lactarius sanguifluus]|nr:hypothetical protein EDB89DRAFT_1984391 [Lactarius sanguifluus]